MVGLLFSRQGNASSRQKMFQIISTDSVYGNENQLERFSMYLSVKTLYVIFLKEMPQVVVSTDC